MRFAVESYGTPGIHQVNPTIAAGDFTVATDAGAFGNPATIPAVSPAAGVAILVSLSAGEMNGDNISLRGHDLTASLEWCDVFVNIMTTP